MKKETKQGTISITVGNVPNLRYNDDVSITKVPDRLERRVLFCSTSQNGSNTLKFTVTKAIVGYDVDETSGFLWKRRHRSRTIGMVYPMDG